MQESFYESGNCVQIICAIQGVHPTHFSPTSVQLKSEINGAFPCKRHQKQHLEFCTTLLRSGRKFNPSRCFRCAYEFRAILGLLQSCSKESARENMLPESRNWQTRQTQKSADREVVKVRLPHASAISDLTVVAKKRGGKRRIKGYASGFCEQFSAARVTTGSQNA